jgi:hypothetical protein
VAVLEAETLSTWSHVTVSNAAGIDLPGWQLTGGVTFYRSDVEFSNCTFRGSAAEDALNVANADFRIADTRILETVSDGFDADFADGRFTGGLFSEIGRAGGGDALDVSGSVVEVDGTRFEQVGDKALSVGERSRVKAKNLVALDVGVGAACKDASDLVLLDSRIAGARVAGLMAYIKKPEYGPAAVEARNVTVEGTERSAWVQVGSRVTLNGRRVETEKIDVEKLYETVMTQGGGGQ